MAVYVDGSLTKDKDIAFNTGSHNDLLQVSYADFERLVKPKVLKFSSLPDVESLGAWHVRRLKAFCFVRLRSGQCEFRDLQGHSPRQKRASIGLPEAANDSHSCRCCKHRRFCTFSARSRSCVSTSVA
jgi:hypothetical protein